MEAPGEQDVVAVRSVYSNIGLSVAALLSVITIIVAPVIDFLGTFGSGQPYFMTWNEIAQALLFAVLLFIGPLFALILSLFKLNSGNRSLKVTSVIVLSVVALVIFFLTLGGTFIKGVYLGRQSNLASEQRRLDKQRSVVENAKTNDISLATDIIDKLELDPAIFAVNFTDLYRNPAGSVSTADYEASVATWRKFVLSHTIHLSAADSVITGTDSTGNKTTEVYLMTTTNSTGASVPFSVLMTQTTMGRIYLQTINIGKAKPK